MNNTSAHFLRSPTFILLLVLSIVQIGFAKPSPRLTIYEVSALVILAIAGYAIILTMLLRRGPGHFPFVLKVLTFFLFISSTNVLIALARGVSLSGWVQGAYGFFFLITAFISYRHGDSKRGINLICNFVLVLCVGVLAREILFLLNHPYEAQVGAIQAEGQFARLGPSILTQIVAYSLILGKIHRIRTQPKWVQVGLFLCIGMLLVRMVLSFSRSLLMLWLLAPILYLLLSVLGSGFSSVNKFTRSVFAGAVIFVIGALVVTQIQIPILSFADIPQLFLYRFSNIEIGLSNRLAEYADAFAAFKEAPLLGAGYGSKIVISETGKVHTYVHNIFLQLLKDVGLLGMILYLVMIAVFLSVVMIRLRQGVDLPIEAIVVVLALLAYGLVSSMLRHPVANIYLGIFMGGLLARCRSGETRKADHFDVEIGRKNPRRIAAVNV